MTVFWWDFRKRFCSAWWRQRSARFTCTFNYWASLTPLVRHFVVLCVNQGLSKLTLLDCELPLYGCGRTEADCSPWVDEAFAGHHSLAVLCVPVGEPLLPVALPRILGHLGGLEELHLDPGGAHCSSALLATLARCCPNLGVLDLQGEDSPEDLDYAVLRPLAGTLRQLTVAELQFPATLRDLLFTTSSPSSSSPPPPLVGHLERLSIYECPSDLLGAASRLTRLTLETVERMAEEAADGLRSLEVLEVTRGLAGRPAGRLLAASRASLRDVRRLTCSDRHDPVLAALGTMPHLVALGLDLVNEGTLEALPAGLLARLGSLKLWLGWACMARDGLRVASGALRELVLDAPLARPDSRLTLTCPALQTAILPAAPYRLVLDCPRLRRIEGLGPQGLHLQRAMPNLEQLLCPWVKDPTWLPRVLAGSPRLRRVNCLKVALPATLDALWQQAGALSRLTMHLDTHDSLLHLRLPTQLRVLELAAPRAQQLRVTGPGLRSLGLGASHAVQRLVLACPGLARLELDAMARLATLDLTPSSPATAPLPLRTLRVGPGCPRLEGASLLAVLTQHGARLREVYIPGDSHSVRAAWPHLAAALGRLASLTLLVLGPLAANMTLACPTLRQLALTRQRYCPDPDPAEAERRTAPHVSLLEELSVDSRPDRLEIGGPSGGGGGRPLAAPGPGGRPVPVGRAAGGGVPRGAGRDGPQ
ncbi:hypothetical protein PAPYR_2125 [Paratrimastix pyriformis]|uniref:Uncharacterized protein n=1 Tax=Paratrimastix pyriformis TaxID=342808 RepID=A0ABQ8UTY4_9EUKA|nr:hypothetical protein PAPYR_2125 [Paratrimastix pyriformis]